MAIKKSIIVVSVISAMVFSGCTNKETESFQKYLKDGNYIKAADYYEKHKSDIDTDGFSKLIRENADLIINDFNEGRTTISAATVNLQALYSIAPKKARTELNEKMKFISDIEISQNQYNSGMECFNSSRYSEAVEYFMNVVSDDPLYSSAQEKISEAKQKLQDEITSAQNKEISNIRTYISNGKFEDALYAIEDFKSQTNDTEIIQVLTDEIEKAVIDEMNKKIESYFADYDYSSAYNYLTQISYTFAYDAIDLKIRSLEDEYVDYAIENAEKDAASNNYEGASSIIEKAIQEVGADNSSLNEAYNEYRKHLPIFIADMDYMSCEGSVSVDNNLTDNTNVTYRHSLWIDGWGKNPYWVEYFTNGNYGKFTGVCGCSYENRSSSESKYFEVYGDGKLLYTSPTMTSSSIPVSFDIDIGNVRVVKIWYPATAGNNKIAALYDGMFLPKTGEIEVNDTSNSNE